MNNILKSILIKIILPVIIVFAVVVALYFYSQVRTLKNQNIQAVTQQEVSDLIANVGNLVLFPESETPTVATVSDPEVLSGQPFFANALKGDKVLIFTKAGRVILYRPSINKIIEIAPVSNKEKTITKEITTDSVSDTISKKK